MELVLYFYIIKIQESQGEIHVIQMNKYEAQTCVALQGVSFVGLIFFFHQARSVRR